MRSIKNLAATLLVLLISSFAIASDLGYQEKVILQGTEAALFTPWPVFENSLKSWATTRRSYSQVTNSMTLNFGQYQFQLSKFTFQFDSLFSTRSSATNEISLSSQNLQIRLHVDRLSIDQILEQVVNGVVLKVHIVADCGAVDLSQSQATTGGVLQYQFGANSVSTQLKQFALQWPTQSWTVSNIQCTGPSGFNQTLQTELNSELRTANQVLPMVQAALANQIQTQASTLVSSLSTPAFLATSSQTLPVRVEFANFESRPEGLLSHLRFIWGANGGNLRPFNPAQWPQIAGNQPVLLMPQDGISDFIQANVEAQPTYTKVDLQQYDFFKKLRASSFLDFFVWPDLATYCDNSPFSLLVEHPHALKIQWNGDASASLSATGVAWVQSVKDKQQWYYLKIWGPVSGTVTPKLNDGNFSATLSLDNHNYQIAMVEDYVRAYDPNRYMATSVFNDFLATSNKNFSLNFQIPNLQLGPLGQATAKNLKAYPGQIIGMPFFISVAK